MVFDRLEKQPEETGSVPSKMASGVYLLLFLASVVTSSQLHADDFRQPNHKGDFDHISSFSCSNSNI